MSHGTTILQEIYLSFYYSLSQYQIVWINKNQNKIEMWDVRTYKIVSIKLFLSYQTINTRLYIFPASKLFSLVQLTDNKSNLLQVSYYKFPLSQDSDPIFIYQNEEIWTHEYCVEKSDSQSMICVWKNKNLKQEIISFTAIQLVYFNAKYSSKTRSYRIENPFFKTHQIRVNHIWRVSAFKFYLSFSQSQQPSQGNLYPFYILQTDKSTLRQPNFAKKLNLQREEVDQVYFGSYIVIKQLKSENEQAELQNIYYIDCLTESIIAIKRQKHSLFSFYVQPGFDDNTLYHIQIPKSQLVAKISKIKIQIYFPYIEWRLIIAKSILDQFGQDQEIDQQLLQKIVYCLGDSYVYQQKQERQKYCMDTREEKGLLRL